MSVASEITRIANAVADAYDTVEELGGTMPEDEVVANLADAISSIPYVSVEQDESTGVLSIS